MLKQFEAMEAEVNSTLAWVLKQLDQKPELGLQEVFEAEARMLVETFEKFPTKFRSFLFKQGRSVSTKMDKRITHFLR